MSLSRAQQRFVWGWAALLTTTACEQNTQPSALTQIVVVVDSDLGVPEQLDGLKISVTGTLKSAQVDDVLDAEHPLPRSLGVVHSGGPLGPVRVSALGTHAGETIVERVADVYFEKDHTVKLALPLMHSCVTAAVSCDSDQTCDRGVCVASATPELPLFKGDDGPLDASGWVVPMTAVDAGHDAGPDAAQPHDAGVDASAADSGQDDAGHLPLMKCAIIKPETGDSFYSDEQIEFEGKCTNVDGGELPGRWRSSLDGTLNQHASFAKQLSAGMHEISFCLNSASDVCAPKVAINVLELPDISATISSLAQSGNSAGVYSGDAELVAKGAGTGVPPLQYKWLDSFAGQFAEGDTAHYQAPMLAGRHSVRLIVTDARNRTAKAERTFEVHTPAHDTLFESYTFLNNLLGNTNTTVNAITSDGSYHYVGTENGSVLSVSTDMPPSTAGTYVGMASNGSGSSSPSVRDLFLRAGTLYLATSRDVQSCPVTAEKVGACSVLTLNGLSGSSIPRNVRVVTSADTSYMVVGTSLGLWTGSMKALDQGGLHENNTVFSGMTESAGNLWIAASAGLYSYTLGSALTANPKKVDSGPSGLTALVSSTSVVWSSLSEGVASYDTTGKQWNTWTTNYDSALFGKLVSNDVRTVAITHPVIDNVAHDVIWIGTGSGLSRFDPAIPSFTTYTKADGLPDNAVLRAFGLPTNELLLATQSGLSIHRGQ